jgi:hypothetical protein
VSFGVGWSTILHRRPCVWGVLTDASDGGCTPAFPPRRNPRKCVSRAARLTMSRS